MTVKIRYSDFNTYSSQAKIPYTSSDHILIAKTLDLFEKLYQRRQLIRLVGVRYSHLVSGGQQMNLFEDSEELINLYQAMDVLRNRFGDSAIRRANGMDARTLGRMGNPFDGSAPMLLANRKM